MTEPKVPIRRFDVFAEYNRIAKMDAGMAENLAKGYAFWLAKVVAAKKFSRAKALSDVDGAYEKEAEKKKYPDEKHQLLLKHGTFFSNI